MNEWDELHRKIARAFCDGMNEGSAFNFQPDDADVMAGVDEVMDLFQKVHFNYRANLGDETQVGLTEQSLRDAALEPSERRFLIQTQWEAY